MPTTDTQPNILLFHVDNLGMGELGCYGGGQLRGADTRRIDRFAQEGLQLWHYVAEPECTPSRSALMTGRYAIRSGTHTIAFPGDAGGLVAWERTIADVLSAAGYATACQGKWHIGAEDGRWATDHGFDEWYGPPRSYGEFMWPADPWYNPDRDPRSYMVEGRRDTGVQIRHDQPLDLQLRRDIDVEYKRRAVDFMRRSVAEDQPFFLYFNHSMMHWPTIARKDFQGSSGNGDWADCLLELDHDFGDLLDTLDDLGVADNTIVVFAGDNGPEDAALWRGTAGFFDGSLFTATEGGLRTPCVVRWPSHVPAGRSSNGMVHQTDLFTTLLRWVGCAVPDDRVIDGVDQRAFFGGEQDDSNREGCLVWLQDTLHAVKWQDFKVFYARQSTLWDAPQMLATPHIVNLLTDPKEREPRNWQYIHTWVFSHSSRLVKDYLDSVTKEPLVPAGAPLGHVPTR